MPTEIKVVMTIDIDGVKSLVAAPTLAAEAYEKIAFAIARATAGGGGGAVTPTVKNVTVSPAGSDIQLLVISASAYDATKLKVKFGTPVLNLSAPIVFFGKSALVALGITGGLTLEFTNELTDTDINIQILVARDAVD
jgi:hypothetical protein